MSAQPTREEEIDSKLQGMPQVMKLQIALGDLLDMLEEWDSGSDGRFGFAGFYAVNQAERVLGRELSEGPT